jgi:small GTP-binding protein
MAKEKVCIFGLDRAGKTVLTQYLATRRIDEKARPTIAFSITSMEFQSVNFSIWDTPGQPKFRSTWIKGIDQSQVLVYVVDASDKPRFQESKEEFKKVLTSLNNMKSPLLFVFNKMDLPGAKENIPEIKEIFNLESIFTRKVTFFETSCKHPETIDKLREGLLTAFKSLPK